MILYDILNEHDDFFVVTNEWQEQERQWHKMEFWKIPCRQSWKCCEEIRPYRHTRADWIRDKEFIIMRFDAWTHVNLFIMKEKIQAFLKRFSFRTGVIVLIMCIPCYILSFAQALLPISTESKFILWVIFFGLAKTFQYGGLTIVGVDGVKRIKERWKNKISSLSDEEKSALRDKYNFYKY